MRRFLLLSFVLAALTCTPLLASPSSADTSTPTPEPSPTATPYPIESATITIRFVYNGEPVQVFLYQPVQRVTANGERCIFPISPIASYFTSYAILWPLPGAGAGQAPACARGPSTTLRFEFNAAGTIMYIEFVWTGGDTTVDLEVSQFIQVPSPTPSGTATPTGLPGTETPRELPQTGGEPSNRGGPGTTPVLVVVMALFFSVPLVALLLFGVLCLAAGLTAALRARSVRSIAKPSSCLTMAGRGRKLRSQKRRGCAVRRFLLLGLVLAALTGALLVMSPSAANTPTPGPSPTATATPYPPSSSTITIRFVRDGQPITLTFALRVSRVTADGADCTPIQLQIEWPASEFQHNWPLRDRNFPPECRQGPPTLLHFEFNTITFVHLETDVLWNGEDVTTEIEVPPSATGTATPSVTASPAASAGPTASATLGPSPAVLPDAGGRPDADGTSQPGQQALFAGGALLVFGILTAVARRFRRTHSVRTLLFAFSITVVTAAGTAVQSPRIHGQTGNYTVLSEGEELVNGRINVKLAPGADADLVLPAHSLTSYEPLFDGALDTDLSRWWRVFLPEGHEIETVIEISSDPEVEWAEPVALQTDALTLTPNDPCFLPPNTGCTDSQWGLQKIAAAGAWDVAVASSGVTVAVIDSGVDASHDDLQGTFVSEVDYTGQGTGDGCPGTNAAGHGTHVAGIASARTNNGTGVAGVSWGAAVRSYKIFYKDGAECKTDTDWIGDAIRDAVDDDADVINMSFGGYTSYKSHQDAVNYAWNAGAVLVGSAGNDGLQFSGYPAAYSKVISVAASDQTDARAIWSPTRSSNYYFVDIAAPGSSIVSTIPTDSYAAFNGTSMASPHVAGVAALLAARGFANCEIVETLLDPANVDAINWQGGVGRVNAAKALQHWGGAPIATPGNYPDGALVREESDAKVYMLLGGRRYWVHSQADLFAMGYDWKDVQCVGNTFLDFVGTGPADRSLAREFNTSQVHVVYCRSAIDPGARLPVPNAAAQSLLVNNGYAGPTVYVVPPGELAAIPGTLNEKCHIKEHSDPAQYAICDPGRKWHIPNTFVLGRLSNFLGPNSLHVLWDGGLAGYPAEADISACKHTDADGYSDLHEGYMGTIHDAACSATSTPGDENVDAWPPDFNDSRSINVQDALALKPVFGQTMNDQMARYDIVFSQSINISDVLAIKPIFGQSC